MPQAVDVWTIDLDRRRDLYLSEDEKARAARFRFEKDRRYWSHARSVLRQVLARYAGAPASSLSFVYGEHGKPALAVGGLQFNLSHSGEWAMIAVSRESAVGIDVEKIREDVEIAKLLERIGETDVEGSTAELFQRWTRREAQTKALGVGLMEKPPGDNMSIADLTAPEGFAAALALVEGDPLVRYCGGL